MILWPDVTTYGVTIPLFFMFSPAYPQAVDLKDGRFPAVDIGLQTNSQTNYRGRRHTGAVSSHLITNQAS